MPDFSIYQFVTSIPMFVRTCPGDVVGGAIVAVFLVALWQFRTPADDDTEPR
jgi:hypothetical protein